MPNNERGAFIINSGVTSTLRLIHNPVPTSGIIANIPRECPVEVPVSVDRRLRPQFIGDLPPACAGVSRTNAKQVHLAVNAAFVGDRDLLYAAVSIDLVISTLLTIPEFGDHRR